MVNIRSSDLLPQSKARFVGAKPLNCIQVTICSPRADSAQKLSYGKHSHKIHEIEDEGEYLTQ